MPASMPDRRSLLALLLAALPFSRPALAAAAAPHPESPMTDASTSGGKAVRPPPSTLDFKDASDALRLHLSIAYTDAADPDFAALLQAHQKGLSDLARVELAHGTDPALRALAQSVLERTEAVQAQLAGWLAHRAR